MPISFLNPWFWLGALAIAAPIWLHLHRRKESNLLPFSALRFLEDQPTPREQPRRLRNLLLFALRTAALLLLVGAFAWPFLRSATKTPIQESRVYLLDNTFSRQAGGGFERDREKIIADFNRAGPEIQLAVIELSSSPQVLVPFGENRDTAGQKLKELQPSFQRGGYLGGFRLANSLLANSLGERKRIIFLSDNQENQWNENVNTPPFLRDVQVDLPEIPAPARANLALSEPRVQRIFLGDRSLIHFTVKLSHWGEAKTAKLLVRANNQAIFNQTIDLQNQPETLVLQTQWESETESWLQGEAIVEGAPDELPADNHAFFALSPLVEGTVALLAQSSYLRLALSPDIMKGQWATRILEPTRLSAELASNVDADVLCLEASFLQAGDARKLLWRYLTNGRGVILLVNRLTPAISGALRELGFEAQEEVIAAKGSGEKFQIVFSSHPIFHPFLAPEFGKLTDIKVAKYVRMQSGQAMPLIFSEKGNPMFFQGTKMEGKLFVASFGLDREHTSWPVHQTFIPFLDLALQAARAQDFVPDNYEPGNIAQIQLPGSSTVRRVMLRHDKGQIAQAPVEQGKARLQLPGRPGLYQLTHDENSRIEKVIAVNPPSRESQLTYVAAPETVQTWRNATDKARPVSSAQAQASLIAVLQQRFWWWMVLGGILALSVEMIVAELRK